MIKIELKFSAWKSPQSRKTSQNILLVDPPLFCLETRVKVSILPIDQFVMDLYMFLSILNTQLPLMWLLQDRSYFITSPFGRNTQRSNQLERSFKTKQLVIRFLIFSVKRWQKKIKLNFIIFMRIIKKWLE